MDTQVYFIKYLCTKNYKYSDKLQFTIRSVLIVLIIICAYMQNKYI